MILNITKLRKKTTKIKFFFIFYFAVFSILLPISLMNNVHIKIDLFSEEPTQWLNNSNFDSTEYWFYNIKGDATDAQLNIYQGEANYKMIGDNGTYNFFSNLTQDTNWQVSENPDFPAFPDHYEINRSGACVSHYWIEGADQSVAVNWNRNLEMPVNMSDFIITSASLEAICNGTVQATPSVDNDGSEEYTGAIDVMSDSGIDTDPTGGGFQGATGDYIRYYVWISDEENNDIFEVAYNQTYNLGQDDPLIDTMEDTYMVCVPEEILIFYLSTVLSKDYKNFTISIGMRIWCEDNFWQDADNWTLMAIKSVNLTFSYEKKINQFTSASWCQIGAAIDEPNAEVTSAILRFKYKINHTWPASLSPFSEIRILLNDNFHSQSIPLTSATSSFQEAESGGFDVSKLILLGANITLSIQVFLANTFGLNKNITVSIDDVKLEISYIILEPAPDLTLVVYGLTGGIIALVTLFGLYELHFKYPPVVRRARKLRKKIQSKRKVKNPIEINNRDDILNNSYQDKIKILDLEPEPEQPELDDKIENIKQNIETEEMKKEER